MYPSRSGSLQGRVASRSGRNRSLQGRDQCMTDRSVLPNPFFLTAQHAESWSLQGGWGRRIRGDLLGGCLMKTETLKYIHPISPLPHHRQNANERGLQKY